MTPLDGFAAERKGLEKELLMPDVRKSEGGSVSA